MGLSDEMRKLKEEILDSYKKRAEEYQQRLKGNEKLVAEVQKTLEKFRTSHLEMAAALRLDAENLKKNIAGARKKLGEDEKNRLNAFGELMAGISGSVAGIKDEVKDIQKTTESLLKQFASLRADRANELQTKFSEEKANRQKQEKNRIEEYNLLQKNIHEDIKRSKDETQKIITDTNELLQKCANNRMQLTKDRKQRAKDLRISLHENMEERIRSTRAMLDSFRNRMAEIVNENQAMADTLKKELLQSRKKMSENEKTRMKTFDKEMGAIRERVKGIQNEITRMLDNLTQERVGSAKEWKEMADAIALLKKNIASPLTDIKPEPEANSQSFDATEEKEATEKEKASANTMVTENASNEEKTPEPEIKETKKDKNKKEKVSGQQEKIAEPEKKKSLEEKILDFLMLNPKGVKVSEMEKPLGEQRMRIGYVCKKMLEEGKITKKEHSYFPKEKKG